MKNPEQTAIDQSFKQLLDLGSISNPLFALLDVSETPAPENRRDVPSLSASLNEFFEEVGTAFSMPR